MIPEDCRYARSHEWLRTEGEHAALGITDYAAEQLGDVTFVELPAEGQPLRRGEPFGSVESVKAVSDLYAPVDGVVVEVNKSLEEEPGRINEGPYEDGWLVRISLADRSQAEDLLSPSDYAAFLEELKE